MKLMKLFNEFEAKFQLENITKGVERVGERRKYFANESLDLNWIQAATDIIQKRFKSKRYFVGRYTLQQNPSQEISHEDLDNWQADVLRLWDQIAWVSLWFDQKFQKVDCSIDLQRELIELNIDAITQTCVETMYTFLENNLGLDLTPEEPYQYRSASATYEVNGWRNERFAEAIQSAIELFIGEKFKLVEAFIELGPEKNRELIPFFTLTDFLTRIKNAETFADAKIYVQGPRGHDLYVEAFENHQKLYIGTTIEAKEASDIKKIFEKALKLKEISSTVKSEEDRKTKTKTVSI